MPRGPTGSRTATRARLLASSRDVFAERGFHGSSIGDICARAGLTRGAYYSNFASKEELFYALFEAQAERYLTSMRSALAEAVTSVDPIQRFIALASVVDEDDRSWYVLSTEFTLYAIRNPDAAQALAEHDARLRQQLSVVLRQLVEASGRELLVNPALIVRFVVALREGTSAQAYVEPDDPEPRMLESLFIPTLLTALSQRVPGQESPEWSDRAGGVLPVTPPYSPPPY